MAINLTKGQRADVGLTKIAVGLGWDPNDTSGQAFDLDASCFMLGSNGKLPRDEYFVFYGNKTSPDGAVQGADDDRTGQSSAGDDETIRVDLTRVSPDVQEIVFTASIYDFDVRKQNFGQVRNAFIRIYDDNSGTEMMKYELDEDFSIESAVEFGRLYRRGDGWKFEAIGKGFPGGLQTFLDRFA